MIYLVVMILKTDFTINKQSVTGIKVKRIKNNIIVDLTFTDKHKEKIIFDKDKFVDIKTKCIVLY